VLARFLKDLRPVRPVRFFVEKVAHLSSARLLLKPREDCGGI